MKTDRNLEHSGSRNTALIATAIGAATIGGFMIGALMIGRLLIRPHVSFRGRVLPEEPAVS